MFVMRMTSSATLKSLRLLLLCFRFLFMRKPNPGFHCLSQNGHLAERGKCHIFFGLLRALKRHISCCFFQLFFPFLRVLTFNNVLTLCVALFTRFPLGGVSEVKDGPERASGYCFVLFV